MFLLYASKEKCDPVSQDLVATFDSEEQLRAYVQWATLRKRSEGMHDFEQGSILAGYQRWGLEERPGGCEKGGSLAGGGSQPLADDVVGELHRGGCEGKKHLSSFCVATDPGTFLRLSAGVFSGPGKCENRAFVE